MSIFKIPEIILPEPADWSAWSVIACDQFTSEPEYWQRVKEQTEGRESALRFILPEVYLSADNTAAIQDINAAMQSFLMAGRYRTVSNMVLCVRRLANGAERKGVMLSVDLEAYEYTEQNDARIKATEKTVVDRLPVRVEIRKHAPIEMPHIMLLQNDPANEWIDAIAKKAQSYPKLYDFALNMGGGHLEGYEITDSAACIHALERAPYGKLLAVGDGNHSLAAAKLCWEERKVTLSKQERENHPARFALIELVNLFDPSLSFEAIHRVIEGAGLPLVHALQSDLKGDAKIKIIYDGIYYDADVPQNPADAIADIQTLLDAYCAAHPECTIDYIHGDENLQKVSNRAKGVGVFMPVIQKEGLFDYVARRGVLPRKSFSMGYAQDKRYYLEMKKII